MPIPSIPENYPESVKQVLVNDLLTRNSTDPVRIAFELANDMHAGQMRKSVSPLAYITHPLRVYDIVSRFVDGKQHPEVLAASLLHDTAEDYRKEDVKKGVITAERARGEAFERINSAYSDRPEFAKRLSRLVEQLSNPIGGKYHAADGSAISKEQWQSDHAARMDGGARIIKIADQAANVISTVEERPSWDLDKRLEYGKKATAVVEGALVDLPESDPLAVPVRQSAEFFRVINEGPRRSGTAGRFRSGVGSLLEGDGVPMEGPDRVQALVARGASLQKMEKEAPLASFLVREAVKFAKEQMPGQSSDQIR